MDLFRLASLSGTGDPILDLVLIGALVAAGIGLAVAAAKGQFDRKPAPP